MDVTTILGSSKGGGPGFLNSGYSPLGHEEFVSQCVCVCVRSCKRHIRAHNNASNNSPRVFKN